MTDSGSRFGFQTSVAVLGPLLDDLEAQGVGRERILRSVGLDPALLADPQGRIPIEWLFELGRAAIEALGDPAYGLHLSERYRPRSYGILDYLAHNSATLGDALNALCQFNGLLLDGIETRLERTSNSAIIWNHVDDALPVPDSLIENSIANLIVIGRELTGRFLVPTLARFRHPAPSYSDEHRRIFRSPVEFQADRDALVLPLSAMEFPVLGPDLWLSSVLEKHARELLGQTSQAQSTRHRVLAKLASELRRGAPSGGHVARALGVSERSLRRRLKEEGTSWAELLDEFRRDMAQRYLADPALPYEEVAHMLGYAEGGAFRRAYRRWHAMSPSQYRKALAK